MNEKQSDYPLYEASLQNYFQYLVDHFFKILPMKEQGEDSVAVYMESLKFEILGFNNLFVNTRHNAMVVTLLSILQKLIDTPSCEITVVRREVFHAISICNKLKDIYAK